MKPIEKVITMMPMAILRGNYCPWSSYKTDVVTKVEMHVCFQPYSPVYSIMFIEACNMNDWEICPLNLDSKE